MTERPRGVFGFLTSRPVAVTMAFVTLLAFGWQSLGRLPVSLLPDISYPTVTVRVEYPGAAPEDVEERVTKRLHEALSVLSRLASISSVSRAEFCDVSLEFAWGTPLTFAIQDIRERLDRTLLPLEVKPPIILRFDPTLDPVMLLGLTGGRDLIELRRLAEDRLAHDISTIEGVAAVRVRGGLTDEIQVRLQPDRLATWGLRTSDIAARLAAENVNMASGTVLEGDTQYLVRILNEYRDPGEIARTVLLRDGDSIVRLGDVAVVARTTKDRDVITRIDGAESVELQIFKEADANIVDLARRVREGVLGTAGQRDWVARLHAGAIEDPDAALLAFRRRVEADPLELAALQRITAAQNAFGGGPPQGPRRGGGGGTAEAGAGEERPDTRSAAERALDERLSAELAELRAAVRAKEEAFAYKAADLPADVHVHLLSDHSRFIESAITEVRDAGLYGALLSIVVLYLFLGRLSSTLIIAVAIPVSVVVSFTPLHLSGTTLNVMSLGGLALGIGMLVDNSIVALESIARCRDEGQGLIASAVNGTREIAAAIVASTLTTVAVFAPIVFVEGIAGQVFRDQALTVVVSLLASLLVALALVPMLASRGRDDAQAEFHPGRAAAEWLRLVFARVPPAWAMLTAPAGGAARALLIVPFRLVAFALLLALDLAGRAALLALGVAAALAGAALWAALAAFRALLWLPGRLFDALWRGLARAYEPFIGGVVASPATRGLVLAVALALFGWTIWAAGRLGSELLPEVHQGEVIARLALPVGTPLETTSLVAREAEALLAGRDDVAWYAVTVGVPRDEISQPDEGEHTARVTVGLRPAEDLAAAEDVLIAALRERLAERPELRDVRFERPTLFTARAPIVVEIRGDDLALIGATARDVESALRELPGLRDVRNSVQPGSPEVMLSFDRDLLSRYGLDTRTVATAVANMVQGTVPTKFSDAEKKLDVLVQVDKQGLTSLDELMRLPTDPGGAAGSGPLAALASSQVREGPREIRRIWGQRAAVVSASLSGFDIGNASEAIRARLETIEPRGDVSLALGGQGREMDGALGQMGQALLLAVFLVYVVMASIFESLLQPLIILVTVPLALVGSVAALWLLDVPLSVVVFIGAIILAGIVVNNAIVLIDAINRRRRLDGQELGAAIASACAMRLRPILMTTLTTVLGLLPLTGWLPLTSGQGAELRAPMAITVVTGLTVATALTLIVIPTIYALVEGALERRRARAD